MNRTGYPYYRCIMWRMRFAETKVLREKGNLPCFPIFMWYTISKETGMIIENKSEFRKETVDPNKSINFI